MLAQASTIPNGWKMTKLGNQIKVGRGSSPRPIQDFISDHGIPWVKIADASASETRYIVKTKEFIKEEGRSTSVKIGDLIVSNSATPGIPKFLGMDACVHDGWLVFSDYKDIDKLYLYYFFLDYRRTLEHSASGTVFVNLQTDIVRNIEMILPPITEQKAIAAVLASLDDKIELLRIQNKTLESVAQAIFKKWFVYFSYSGATGEMIDSEFGKIPEGWRVGTLNDYIGELESGKRPKGGVGQLKQGVPSVGAESINGISSFNFSKTKYISEDFFQNMNMGKVKEYDILVYKDGGTPGTFRPKFTMVGEGFPFSKFSINEHVFRVQPKKIIQRFFLYIWLNSFYCKRELQNIGGKAAIPGINSTDFRRISLLLPNEKILTVFHLAVSPIFKKILINNSQIKMLSSLRDTLLPKLMRGEVRVDGFNN